MASGNPSPRWLEEEAKAALLDEQQQEEGGDEEGGAVPGRKTPTLGPPAGKAKKPKRRAPRRAPADDGDDDEAADRKRRITKPFFAVLSTFTVLLSLGGICWNLYSLITWEGTATSILPRVHRGFAIVLTLVAMLTELRIKWWKKLCPVLFYHSVLGFFLCLVASLSLTDFEPSDENVVGFLFLAFGFFYMSLGVLCIHRHVEID